MDRKRARERKRELDVCMQKRKMHMYTRREREREKKRRSRSRENVDLARSVSRKFIAALWCLYVHVLCFPCVYAYKTYTLHPNDTCMLLVVLNSIYHHASEPASIISRARRVKLIKYFVFRFRCKIRWNAIEFSARFLPL